MSSASEQKEPLLPRDQERSIKAENLSKLQPCANFLLDSDEGVWYKGEIHKNNNTIIRAGLEKSGAIFEFSKFISHKFVHENRTFCLTFRKNPIRSTHLNKLGGIGNVFSIRLSLIEEIEEDNGQSSKRNSGVVLVGNNEVKVEDEKTIKCRGKESLKIEIGLLGGVTLPDGSKDKHFSSITSGGTPDQISIVQNMREIPENEDNQYNKFYIKHISPHMKNIDVYPHMKTLGEILVEHFNKCGNSPSPVSPGGGATRKHTRLTRRRKGVFKRKGKKSYKKKKYGKTKKSRRFKRSGRSRR